MNPILLNLPNELITARLLLRVPRAGDGVIVNAGVVESIAELAPWMPWANPTPKTDDAEIWCRQAAAKFLTREQLHFSIYRRDDSAFVGNCGMHRINWEISTAEIGYWLRTCASGSGYMTEALNALTHLAFDVLKLCRIEIRCDERNLRSARVAERADFMLEGTLRNDTRDSQQALRSTRVYARLRACD